MTPPAWHHVAILGLFLGLAGLNGFRSSASGLVTVDTLPETLATPPRLVARDGEGANPVAKSRGARPTKRDVGEMVLVPAGQFLLGSYDEKWVRRVYLDAYRLDKHEVTNAEYRRFVDATGRAAPSAWGDSRFNGPTQPVVGVTWHDAEAYCRWVGKRLPTEAEWEKAARGPDGRRYPWGDRWDASRANSSESKLGKTAPVGSYPTGVSPYGAHDMAGNVWEWVADWYAFDSYRDVADSDRESPYKNPKGPDTGTSRVLRGGSWDAHPADLATTRTDGTPTSVFVNVGIRCAKGSP